MSLRTENLTIYYQTINGNVRALEDASFSLADGEIMGVAGESGCGKSTLSNSLIYLHTPMKYIRGRVFLDDEELFIQDSAKMDSVRYKKISVIPQYAMNALNPTRKIGAMIKDLIKSRNEDFDRVMPQLQNRLELVKLAPDVLNMYPFELSGGMKQRMVMVISTLLDPSLLLADEVTSALDVSSQKAVAEMLVGFRDNKIVKSIMMITHDISILYQTANSIMVMYAGQLAEKASTEIIINSPRHPYTKLLISSLPSVGVRIDEHRLAGIPGNPPLLLNPPTGCRFRDRCPVAFDKCAEVPPFVEIEKGHFIACWREVKSHA
ncbi:MAG: ABC transporter ATP-binding protein [Leptolinea sp.]|nr:ABC transporter ATP-binding protein [Leptolinea sp.]